LSLVNVAAVVGTSSVDCPTKLRIQAGSSTTSYLVDKIRGASQTSGGCFMGLRMPRNQDPLTAEEINTIASWIDAGAN
jgi:hypothetical protein